MRPALSHTEAASCELSRLGAHRHRARTCGCYLCAQHVHWHGHEQGTCCLHVQLPRSYLLVSAQPCIRAGKETRVEQSVHRKMLMRGHKCVSPLALHNVVCAGCARSGNTSKTANVDPGCWYPPDERHLPDPIKEPIEIFGYLHACALDQEQVGPDAARFFSSNKSSSPYCACFPSVM